MASQVTRDTPGLKEMEPQDTRVIRVKTALRARQGIPDIQVLRVILEPLATQDTLDLRVMLEQEPLDTLATQVKMVLRVRLDIQAILDRKVSLVIPATPGHKVISELRAIQAILGRKAIRLQATLATLAHKAMWEPEPQDIPGTQGHKAIRLQATLVIQDRREMLEQEPLAIPVTQDKTAPRVRLDIRVILGLRVT